MKNRPTYKTELHDLIRQSPGLAESTKNVYLRDLDRYIHFVGTDPKKWTRTNTARFYTDLLGKIKPQSANRVLASIRYVAHWYASRAVNPKLEFAEIQLAANKKGAVREALDADQVRAMLDTCSGRAPRDLRDYAMMVTAIETGMRRISLVSMAWENTVVTPAMPVAKVKLKGVDELYSVPMSDTAMLALEPWKAWSAERLPKLKGPIIRRLRKSVSAAGPALGPGFTESAVYQAFDTRSQAAGIGHVHPHIFRHTFITWRLNEAKLTSLQVAAITGHRLPGDRDGELYTYAEKKALGATARNYTPAWLVEHVERFVRGPR